MLYCIYSQYTLLIKTKKAVVYTTAPIHNWFAAFLHYHNSTLSHLLSSIVKQFVNVNAWFQIK
jgi:hypothetical protein